MVNKIRTCVSLNKKQICFLDKISKDCKFSEGRKLSRTSIIRALLIAGRKLNINVRGARSEHDLKERIVASCKL